MSEILAQLKQKGGEGFHIVQKGYELFCYGSNGQFELRALVDGNKVSVTNIPAAHIINIENFTTVTGGNPYNSGWVLVKKDGTEILSGNITNLDGYDYLVYTSNSNSRSFTFTFS